MLWFAIQACVQYAFEFGQGYSLLPLAGLCACLWAYNRLRPAYLASKSVTYVNQSADPLLLLLLSAIGAAFFLQLRGEHAFQPLWFVHLATLTLFQLLIPYMIATLFSRRQTLASAIAVLFLLGMMWKGTELNRGVGMRLETVQSAMNTALFEG